MRRFLSLILIITLLCCQISYADTTDGIESESFEVTQWDGISAPSVAPTNSGRIYYDQTLDYMLLSENSGAYSRLLSDAPSDGTMYGRRDGAWERISLLPPVYDWWDPTGGLPVAPADGDRYIADGDGSGWTDGYIYEWDDTTSTWIESDAPEDGWMFWMIAELLFYVFFSGGWMEVGSGSYWSLDTAQMGITGDKSGLFDLTTTGDITGSKVIIANPTVPVAATSVGTKGEIAYDTDYLYVCISDNTWKRVGISTWAYISQNVIFDGQQVTFGGQNVVH